MLHRAWVVLLVVFGIVSESWPQERPADPTIAWTRQGIHLSSGVAGYMYRKGGDGTLPPDLMSLIPQLAEEGEGPREVVQRLMMPPRTPLEAVPEKVDAAWIEKNASFVYLGRAGIHREEVPVWGDVVLFHMKLDQGVAVGEGEPLISVGFFDTHGEVMPRSEAEKLIAFSKGVFEALANGTPLPDSVEALADFAEISRAMRAYGAAHDDFLPPDLGALLEYVPESKRLSTPAKRASVFLSPRAKRNTHIPAEPTREWVNQNTRLVYLGGADLRRGQLADPERTVLVHVRPEDAIEPVRARADVKALFPMLEVSGQVEKAVHGYYEWVLGYSRDVIRSARTGSALPPCAEALQDLGHLHAAAKEYAKAHGDALPPRLSDLWEYLPEGMSARDRARVFMSPRAERTSPPPEEADRAWAELHTTYKYVADPGVRFKAASYSSEFLLAHAPLDEVFTVVFPDVEGERRVFPAVGPMGPVYAYYDDAYFEKMLQWSKEAYAEARAKAAAPAR